jgi:microcystin-dependent protein
MATSNYSWNLPTVGGSEDTWGTQLNANWTALDTLLGGVSQTEFAILDGATVTTAELNILDGVTATTAEINTLDGVTATTAEINYLSGVTSSIQNQIDNLSIIPSGAVMPFAMNTAPSGWLKADGSSVSRSTYAALFAAIGTTFGAGDGSTTFALPDMRGEFARGWDDGRGVDTGRVFGSAQADEFKSHNHPPITSGNNFLTVSGGGLQIGSGAIGRTDNATTGNAGGAETRPRNIALLYCIKT